MWWRRRRTEDDFAEEVRAHLDVETDRLVAEGLSPEAARLAARRAFGSVLAAQERFHESRGLVWFDQFRQDLRYGWRGVFRSRAFAATTVLTLAVALSLTTVVFTIFNAYVLRPVRRPRPVQPARDPLASRRRPAAARSRGATTSELRERDDVFDAVAGRPPPARSSSDGRNLGAAFVSGNYFDALGARVLLGRALATFDATEPGAAAVVVLSHQAWTRLFDRDPGDRRPVD